jgi:hypothetical protein
MSTVENIIMTLAGSIPDEVIGLFSDLILQLHYIPGVDSASNRNEYQTIFLSEARPARKASNFTAICDPIV